MNKEGLKYAGGMGAGLASVAGAGYADLKNVEYQMQKERDDKNADKVEKLKRKEEPSGGDTKQPPKIMKKGGKVKSASARADGCAIRGKTRA
jgi:hypothetical protein